jgi:hypothetical protein
MRNLEPCNKQRRARLTEIVAAAVPQAKPQLLFALLRPRPYARMPFFMRCLFCFFCFLSFLCHRRFPPFRFKITFYFATTPRTRCSVDIRGSGRRLRALTNDEGAECAVCVLLELLGRSLSRPTRRYMPTHQERASAWRLPLSWGNIDHLQMQPLKDPRIDGPKDEGESRP